MVEGTLAAPSVQGHRLPLTQEWRPHQCFFELLVAGNQKTSLASFSIALPVHALRGLSCLVSSAVQNVRHIEGPPWLGCYSVDLRVSHLMEHPGWGLQFSASGVRWANHSIVKLQMLEYGERGYADGSTSYVWLTQQLPPCFHGCLTFLHRNFPPQSPPSHLDPSPQTTAVLALGFLYNP